MAGIAFQPPQHPQDMARDKEKPHLDVILDSQYLVLKGTGPDVEPTTLSGHVTLFLTEATSIKEITLQFRGKAKISDPSASSSHIVCSHDWSFLEGDKKHSHTLKAGRHFFPFHLEISGSLPSSIYTSALGGASVAYKLRAVATRTGFSHNLQAVVPVYILRSITREDLEYHQTLDIENTWPDKLMYAITLPHKAWAAGDTLIAIAKLSPLAKGVYVQAIVSSISETTKICAKSGIHENTRVVASVRHEIIDHKAVEVELASSATPGSSSPSETAVTHFTHSPRSSRPASPHHGHSSSHHFLHHHHPLPHQQEQQEEEDLGSKDVVTCINLSIPPSSAYPLLYSASTPASVSPHTSHHVTSSSHSQPSGTFLSFTNASHNTASPTTTPPRSTSPTHQHGSPLLHANSTASYQTSSSGCSLPPTPSHGLEPILISHRIRWSIYIHNKDGHVSELRCSLPIKIMDGALLDESRQFTMRSRRLLLRASGLGSVLSRGGEEGSGGDDDEAAGADGEEETTEADRELPSYPAHVRDRVANMYLSEAVTRRVSNPWVGRAGPAGGRSALSTPEILGQGESDINPLAAVVLPNELPAFADRSTPHTQPHSRASRSGRSTPAIQSSHQQVHMMSHLPHAPGLGERTPLDWVNSELLLSLSLDGEALRLIRGVTSSVGGQQQSQPHQDQTHVHNQQNHQQSRILRWGSRVGSMAGSRASSPERSALSSVTTVTNHDNSGFASPFQNLFKASMKPFATLTGHYGHGQRPTQPRSRSTNSLTGLHSTAAAEILSASASGSGRPLALGSDPSQISSLSPTRPPFGAGPISSSSPPAPQTGTNGLTSVADPTFGTIVPSPSPLSETDLESTSGYPFHTVSMSGPGSPLSHIHQLESEDPSPHIYRAFSIVPDYSIASRGFIGGVPPLSSTRGLPSYEEAEAQWRERSEAQVLRDGETQSQMQTQLPIPNQGQTFIQTQTQTQTQNQVMSDKEKMKMKMKERGSMSEPDLAGRFGLASVRFESGMQVETEIEAGTHSMHRDTGGGVGIMQRLQDGDDGDEDDGEDGDGDDDDDDVLGGIGAIHMRTKKARS